MGFHLIPKEYYSGLSLGDEIAMGTYHVKQDGKKNDSNKVIVMFLSNTDVIRSRTMITFLPYSHWKKCVCMHKIRWYRRIR